MHKLLLTILLAGTALLTQAQAMVGTTTFEFPNGIMEWSTPVNYLLESESLTKEGMAGIPVEIRIKVKKKVMMACHYELEVKNLSDKSIKCSFYNSYTDATGKYIMHDFKIKPGEIGEDTIIYSELGCKVKEDEDCNKCSWTLYLDNASAK
jgi:hypothetical protein